VRPEFEAARLLQLLERLTFTVAERLMPVLILRCAVDSIHYLMPFMDLAPFLHGYPPR
jgi:hypothetical protein